jgi:N-acetylneuraminic acid mutarotase
MQVLILLLLALCMVSASASDQNWKTLDTNGPGPLPRDAMATQAFGDLIYTFAGFNENLDPLNPAPNVFHNDIWVFDTDSKKWTQKTPLPDESAGFPIPRAYSLAGANGNDFIVGFGITYNASFGNVVAYNDLWAYNTNTNRWKQIQAQNTVKGPGPRAEVSAVVHGGKIFLFGGSTAFFTTADDTWVFDIAKDNWTQIVSATKPSPRYGTACTLDTDNNRMIIYAGEASVFVDYPPFIIFPLAGPDVQWQLDLTTLVWTEIVPLYSLPERNNGNGAIYHNGLFFIFGGDIGGGQACNDAFFKQNNVNETWVWDSNINMWIELCPTVAPLNFKRASSVLVGDDVYMFGGFAFFTPTCGPYIFGVDVYRFHLQGCYGGTPCAVTV